MLPYVLATVLAASSATETPEANTVAAQAFAAAGTAFVELDPNIDPIVLARPAMNTAVRIATAPRSSGHPGLCVATVATVRIGAREDQDPLITENRYKVVGDLSPLPSTWNPTYAAELAAECKRAGRVLPIDPYGLGSDQFFSARLSPGSSPYEGLLALQGGIDAAKKRVLDVHCTPSNTIDCASAAAIVAALDFAQLTNFAEERCRTRLAASCYSAAFVQRLEGNAQTSWIIRFALASSSDRTTPRLVDLEVSSGTVIVR